MGNCQVCGAPSGMYPLCTDCFKLKEKEEIRRCDDCGKWMEGKNALCRECRGMMQRKAANAKKEGVSKIDIKPSIKEYPIEQSKDNSTKRGGLLSMAGRGISGIKQKTVETTGNLKDRIGETAKNVNESLINAVTLSEDTNNKEEKVFRKNNFPQFKTDDGHFVRSKTEQIIDNWLFSKEIIHTYEKYIYNPTGQDMYCDFYLPYNEDGEFLGNSNDGIYVEFWGMTEIKSYVKRMNEKLAFYKELGVTLVNLYEKNMDTTEKYLNLEIGKYLFKKKRIERSE